MLLVTKKSYKKLFKIFSLILLLDYPILPLVFGIIRSESGCEYSTITCITVMISMMMIIFIFWTILWLNNYIIFFLDDYKNKIPNKGLFNIPYFYIKYVQSSFKGKLIQSFSNASVLLVVNFGVIYLFFYELYNAIISN